MFASLALSTKSLDEYASLPGVDVDHLRRLAEPLRGARVLNLSVTTFGTSVADLIGSSTPLLQDLGLDAHWQAVRSYEAPELESAIYNAIAGAPTWSADFADQWGRYNQMNAGLYEGDWDFVVVHDPQPAGILSALRTSGNTRGSKWIWHCHLDLNSASEGLRLLLRSQADVYDAVVFDLPQYTIPELGDRLEFIRPAIDPLDPHNADVSSDTIQDVITRLGIDPSAPLVVQVAPLDRWHDASALVEPVREARKSVPGLQLVLVANITRDDPETRAYFQQIVQKIEPGEPVHVISTLDELGYVGINVFQRAADVVVLRNVRKGLSMRLLDAMWKARPVIARPAGAMAEVVIDGQTGWLADSDEQWTAAVVEALQNKGEAGARATRGSELVRDQYLITRYLADYLELFKRLR
ncbi:MAG: glycosyltransferase [Dehalococcoidia bacterium]